MSEKGFRIEIPVNIRHKQPAPKVGGKDASRDSERDDVPRIARLLALAHKWEGMVQRGETDYFELARRDGLSRARVSQICSLTLVAPEIQEIILGLTRAHNPGTTGYLRLIAAHPDWEHQRRNLADAVAGCLEVRG